jgi:hypothetical protein
MWGFDVRFVVSASVLLACAPLSAQAADLTGSIVTSPDSAPSQWGQWFAGATVLPNTISSYVGGSYAFNQNFAQDGFVLRGSASGGEYSYLRTPSQRQRVPFQNGDLSVGYQTYANGVHITVSLGANVENDNNGDPTAVVKGTKWGVKGQADIYAPLGGSFYAYGQASYSTAWSSFALYGKIGYRLTDALSIGPEVSGLGDINWDCAHAGAFLSYSLSASTDVGLSGGYARDLRSQGVYVENGGYVGLNLGSKF